VCGKYGFIDWLIVFIMRPIHLAYCFH
jgi:hypothetical protein